MSKETHVRSITKSCSYRVFGTVTTILIAFVVTQSFPASLGIGIVDLISKIILFYTHDRIWQNIKWGKE